MGEGAAHLFGRKTIFGERFIDALAQNANFAAQVNIAAPKEVAHAGMGIFGGLIHQAGFALFVVAVKLLQLHHGEDVAEFIDEGDFFADF